MSRAKLYSSVLVKVGIERSFLLSEEKLQALTRCKTLEDFASELKGTIYGERIISVSKPYSARKFERVFGEKFIETCCRIVQNSPKVTHEFLKTYLLRFEIQNLKAILRAVSLGLSFEEIENRIYMQVEDFLQRRDVITQAVRAINVRSVIEALKNTEYGPLLSAGLKKYEETGSLKPFEVLMDKMFYQKLGESFKKLPKKEQRHAFFYVSMENDCFNLCVILRAKNLGYDPHWVRMAISRESYRIPKEVIENLLMVDDFDSALRIVRQTYYKRFFENEGNPEDIISSAEKEFRKALLTFAKKTRVGEIFNIGAVLGLLIQKENEARNLTAISLGIEYGLNPEEISATLLL